MNIWVTFYLVCQPILQIQGVHLEEFLLIPAGFKTSIK